MVSIHETAERDLGYAALFSDADRDQARDRLEAYGWRSVP
jgi:hypothetical protein